MPSDSVSATYLFMPGVEATDGTVPLGGWCRAGVTSTQTRGLQWVAKQRRVKRPVKLR